MAHGVSCLMILPMAMKNRRMPDAGMTFRRFIA
jgi:hypothetical protein